MVRYKNSREHCHRARSLRQMASTPEKILWDALREFPLTKAAKFRRQHPIAPYIADFACIKARMIIEVDGYSHDLRQSYDARRDNFLSKQGWTVMRFTNSEVETNLEGVMQAIVDAVEQALPQPLPQAGGEI